MVVKKKVFYLILEDNMVKVRHQSILLVAIVGDRVGGLVWDKVWLGYRLCRVIFHCRVYRIIVLLGMIVFRRAMSRRRVMAVVEVGRKHRERAWILRRW